MTRLSPERCDQPLQCIAAATFAGAAAASGAIGLAVPYDAAADVVAVADDNKGKLVVDITNAMKADFSGLRIGHRSSTAEDIQKIASAGKVVKTFNTVIASVLLNSGKASGKTATMFFAGDDAEARKSVEALADRAGFKSLEVGGLAAARHLEQVAASISPRSTVWAMARIFAPTWQGIA